MQRISMADIAKEAGVSRPTVSRVLQGDSRITPETAEKVRRIAAQMGYRREAAFDILAQQRKAKEAEHFRYTLAFLHSMTRQSPLMLQGANAQAERLGYALDSFEYDENTNMAALERMIQARGIKGILLPLISRNLPVPRFNWTRLAAVACSVDYFHPPFHIVRTNVVAKVEIAWKACVEAGFRRIGIALSYDAKPHELDIRRAGVAMYWLSAQPRHTRIPLWFERFGEPSKLMKWLGKHRPEVVIAGDTAILNVLDRYGRDQGERLPRCCLIPSEGCPHLSSQPELIGSTALTLLHQHIVTNQLGPPDNPFTVVIEPKWVAGEF